MQKKRSANYLALLKSINFKGGLEKAINDYRFMITIKYDENINKF